MNPKAIGELSEGMIFATLLRLGIHVSFPFGNNQRYDMILDVQGRLIRAQCKTGRLKNGAVRFPTRSVNGFTGEARGYAGQADIFLVYCPETDQCYFVPVCEAGGRECSIRVSQSQNGQTLGVRHAKDCMLSAISFS